MEINRGDRAERLKSNDSPSGGSGKRARLADDASTSLLVCQRSKTESDDCVVLAGNNMIQRPWALTMESLRSYSRPKNKHEAYLDFFRTPELDSALKFLVACHYAPTPDQGALDATISHCLNHQGTSFVMYSCNSSNAEQLHNESVDFSERRPEMMALNIMIGSSPRVYGCVRKRSVYYILPPEERVPIGAFYDPAGILFTAAGHEELKIYFSLVHDYESVTLADPFVVAPSRSLHNNIDRFPMEAIGMQRATEHIGAVGFGSVGIGAKVVGSGYSYHVQFIDLKKQDVREKYIRYLDERPQDFDSDSSDNDEGQPAQH